MDSAGMHIDFRVKANRVNSLKNKVFQPQEIDLFLNDQMSRFIENAVNSVVASEGFEDIQKNLDDVRTLVKTDSSNAAEGGTLELKSFDRGKYILIPDDYLKRIRVSSDTYNDCLTYRKRPVRMYDNEIVDTILVTEFYRSHVKSPVGDIHNSKINVYEDNFTVNSIYLTYLTTYPSIVYNDTDCILPDHTHREIVDMAVSKVNSVINAGNYEKYLNEISNND